MRAASQPIEEQTEKAVSHSRNIIPLHRAIMHRYSDKVFPRGTMASVNNTTDCSQQGDPYRPPTNQSVCAMMLIGNSYAILQQCCGAEPVTIYGNVMSGQCFAFCNVDGWNDTSNPFTSFLDRVLKMQNQSLVAPKLLEK
jgi:hypothetical protein